MKTRLRAATILATLALVTIGTPVLAATAAPAGPTATLCITVPGVQAFGQQLTSAFQVCIPWP